MKLVDDFVYFLSELRKKLCDKYRNRVRHFQPLSWIEEMQFNLENVYTELSIVKRDSRRRWVKTDQIVQLSDIFDEDEKSKPRIILIEGSPGMGKTTLSLKLAYDWAKDQMPDKFPKVELVLLIKCRDMKGSIQESAKTQLLPSNDKQLLKDLDSFFHSAPNKIMLIVDGVDEISEANESHVLDLLKGGCLQDCNVILTSRQEKGKEVRKYCDKLLEINGYSDESRNNYINRYFERDIDLAEKLQEKIETNTENNLLTLATNPLNTLLLCVVFEDNDGNLPTTVTKLYQKIVGCIWKRYCKKKRPEEKDISFEMAKQTLGRLAYESLIEHDTLYFRESMLREDEIQCTNIGFLYKDDILRTKILKPDSAYCFLHKTFQEYFAAYHCVYTETEIDKEMSKLSHYTWEDGAKFIQVLKFMSSMLQKKSAEDHKEFIKQLGSCISSQIDESEDHEVLHTLCAVLSENDLNKEIAGTVKTFIKEEFSLRIDPDNEYFLKIMPRILNLLGTESEDNQKVKLGKLTFSDLFSNDTEWLKLICEALMKNLVVDTILLESCILEVNYLQEMLSNNSTVRALYLEDNDIDNEGLDILAKGLCKNSTLETLTVLKDELGFENESPSKFTGMAEMLATNDKLKELSLDHNPLDSRGVTWIAEALKSNEGVKHLSLRSTLCDDEGAAQLASMLGINKTLENLYLCSDYDDVAICGNDIGDKGAIKLADVLKEHNSSLKVLHLCRNTDITDKGLRKLTETVQKNKALTLYIDGHEQIMTCDEETMVRIKPGCSGNILDLSTNGRE